MPSNYQHYLIEYLRQMNLWNAEILAEAHWLTIDEIEDVILDHMETQPCLNSSEIGLGNKKKYAKR